MGTRSVYVVGQVVSVSDKYAYPSCVKCRRRIRTLEDVNLFWCSNCRRQYRKEDVQYRYRVNMTVSDRSQVSPVTVFGSCLETFFGATATNFCRFIDNMHHQSENLPASSAQIANQAIEQCFVGSFIKLGFRILPPCRTLSQITRSSPVQLKNISGQSFGRPSQHLTSCIISKCHYTEYQPSVMEILSVYLDEWESHNYSRTLDFKNKPSVPSQKMFTCRSQVFNRWSVSKSACSQQSLENRQRGHSLLVSPLVLSSESTGWKSTNSKEDQKTRELKSSPVCLMSPSENAKEQDVYWLKGVLPEVQAKCNVPVHYQENREEGVTADALSSGCLERKTPCSKEDMPMLHKDLSTNHHEWTEFPSSEDLSAFLADMSLDFTENEHKDNIGTEPIHPSNNNKESFMSKREDDHEDFTHYTEFPSSEDLSAFLADMSFESIGNDEMKIKQSTDSSHNREEKQSAFEEVTDYTEFQSSEDLEEFLADMDMDSIDLCSSNLKEYEGIVIGNDDYASTSAGGARVVITSMGEGFVNNNAGIADKFHHDSGDDDDDDDDHDDGFGTGENIIDAVIAAAVVGMDAYDDGCGKAYNKGTCKNSSDYDGFDIEIDYGGRVGNADGARIIEDNKFCDNVPGQCQNDPSFESMSSPNRSFVKGSQTPTLFTQCSSSHSITPGLYSTHPSSLLHSHNDPSHKYNTETSAELFSRSMFSPSSSLLQGSQENVYSGISSCEDSLSCKLQPMVDSTKSRRQSTPITHNPRNISTWTRSSLRVRVLRNWYEKSDDFKCSVKRTENFSEGQNMEFKEKNVFSVPHDSDIICVSPIVLSLTPRKKQCVGDNVSGTPMLFSFISSSSDISCMESSQVDLFSEQDDSLLSDSLLECSYL